MTKSKYRVGVLFGGRSGEHEVSLASAQNVMDALTEAGHEVVPIGITRQGRWLATADPMAQLTAAAARLEVDDTQPALNGVDAAATNASLLTHSEEGWELLPTREKASLTNVDVIFPVLHGPYGEDGTIQGLLEVVNVPYVGCGVLASAVAMDKAIAKKLFTAEGLPQTRYEVIHRQWWSEARDAQLDQIEASLRYPIFVKPANLGSSVGVSQATDRQSLAAGIDLASQYDRKVIIEEGVSAVREIEVSVFGIAHSLAQQPIASVVGEIIPGRDFYDYEAKYEDDSSQLLIPAPLDATLSEQIREMALQAFTAVDGSGLARVDFLLDNESGQIYLNEVNTMPGFTRISMYPKLWEASGLSYPELAHRLVELALVRHEDRQRTNLFHSRHRDEGVAAQQTK